MIGCTTNILKGVVRYGRLDAGLGGRMTFLVAQMTFARRASYSRCGMQDTA